MAEIVDFGLQQHKIKMDSRYFENVLSVVAGDTGRRIEVQLLDANGMVQDTTGLNLRLNAEIAGKATFTDATLVDAATGKYQLDLSNGMFLAPGNWQFQWQITDSAGKKLHSFAFTGNIGKNISEGGSQATNFYLNLEDLKKMQDDLINGTFDSEVLETNITEKLTNLEMQYAPKLTEVTAQLTQTEQEIFNARGGYNALADFNDWLTQYVKDISINANTFSTLQEGLNYTSSHKKRLIINEGEYDVDNLIIPAYSNVTGVGEVTFKPINTSNFYVRIAGSNVIFNDLIIDGLNKIDKGLTLDVGVKNISINNIKIKNIYATNKQARGILIQEGCKNIYINECDIDTVYSVPNGIITDDAGSSKGISIASLTNADAEIPQHITIKNTRIANVGPIEDADGIHAYFPTGQMDLFVDNCVFENCDKRFLKIQTNGVLIKNSNFKYDKAMTGELDCLQQVIAYYGNNIRFEDNFIELEDALSVADFSNSISEINSGITFKDNIIKIKRLHGHYGMFYSTAQIEDILFSGNIADVYEKTAVGDVSFIYLRKVARRFNIHDNILKGPLTHGVTIHTQDNIDISDGKIGNNTIIGVSDYLVNVPNHSTIKDIEVFGTQGSNTQTNYTGTSLVRTVNPNCFFHDNVGANIYASLPIASKNRRGTIVTVASTDPAYIDKTYICVHKAGTSLTSSTIEFEWKELSFIV